MITSEEPTKVDCWYVLMPTVHGLVGDDAVISVHVVPPPVAFVPRPKTRSLADPQLVNDIDPVESATVAVDELLKPAVPKLTDAGVTVMHGVAAVTVAATVPESALNTGTADATKQQMANASTLAIRKVRVKALSLPQTAR
jgi:hypothetical protein